MIQFRCPHCQKLYEVKDEVAGKRTKCANCKQTLTVPAAAAGSSAPSKTAPAASTPASVPSTPAPPVSTSPAAPPPEHGPADVEALAAAALADEPPPPAAPEPTTIDFQCPFCDTKVSLSSTLAGKRAPCPECRRIVKVPELQKQEPIDWRKRESRLPSGARQAIEPVPEGAWGTATSSARVSQQALVEAAAVPEVKVRLTAKQWATRIGMALAAVTLVASGVMLYSQLSSQARQQKALDLVLEYLPPDKGPPKNEGKVKLSAAAAGEVRRALAEFHLNAGNPDLAFAELQRARALALNDKSSEQDALLLEIASLQADLGGDKDEVDQEKRLKWERLDKELPATLRSIQAPGARTEALRAVVRKLVRKGQGPRAVGLASRLATGNEQVPEYTALVALEMIGNDDAGARKLAEQAQSHYKPTAGGGGKLPVSPFLIALWMALNAPDKARGLAAEPGAEGEPDLAARLGYAEGYARQGNLDRARQLALARGPLEARLQALAAVAAVALEKSSGDAKDIQAAVDLVEKEGKGRSVVPWTLWRLARSGARAGHTDLGRRLAAAIQDPALRGRTQLEAFRGRLNDSSSMLDFATIEEAVDKQSAAYGVAFEELARHNARRGSSADVLKAIDTWDPEWLRPLGYVGVALGEQK